MKVINSINKINLLPAAVNLFYDWVDCVIQWSEVGYNFRYVSSIHSIKVNFSLFMKSFNKHLIRKREKTSGEGELNWFVDWWLHSFHSMNFNLWLKEWAANARELFHSEIKWNMAAAA